MDGCEEVWMARGGQMLIAILIAIAALGPASTQIFLPALAAD